MLTAGAAVDKLPTVLSERATETSSSCVTRVLEGGGCINGSRVGMNAALIRVRSCGKVCRGQALLSRVARGCGIDTTYAVLENSFDADVVFDVAHVAHSCCLFNCDRPYLSCARRLSTPSSPALLVRTRVVHETTGRVRPSMTSRVVRLLRKQGTRVEENQGTIERKIEY